MQLLIQQTEGAWEWRADEACPSAISELTFNAGSQTLGREGEEAAEPVSAVRAQTARSPQS